ncbi:hypothetical protein NX059_000611 [Plenodomus lindquistii]|nr:hypothetical protein NX059_000611 [Plenodomus lindquistii]
MNLIEILLYCKPTNISLECPAGAPPPGQLPLDPNAYSLVPLTVGVSAACCALVLIAMSIRVFTRTYLVKIFALEDALLLVAAVTFFAFVSTVLTTIPMGLRKHTWNTTIGQLSKVARTLYAAQILYTVHSYPAKIAVVLQIKHTFTSGQKRGFIYWSSWATIAFLTCVHITVLFVIIFPCTPIRKSWYPWMKGGWCMDRAVPGMVGAIGNLLSDMVVLALPVVGVAGLQMKLKRKIAVAAVFTTGSL